MPINRLWSEIATFGIRMRILITGGRGFIGRHVVPLLQEHADVWICDSTACDMTDMQAISSALASFAPTHCLHMAWDTRVGYASAPSNLVWLTSGAYLVRAFFEQGGQRFVGVGTCFEYATVGEKRSETSTLTLPETLYGKSKLALAQFLEAYAIGLELSWAWCRPFYISGPGESLQRLIPSACTSLLGGKTFYTNAYYKTLDYMDVRDVAGALCQVLFSTYCGTVNIASGQGRIVGGMLDMLTEISGTPHRALPAAESEKGSSVIADTTILRKVIGYSSQFTMRETLSACWNDIRSRA